MAARHRTGAEIDRDGHVGAGIAERVDARTTVDAVRTGATDQHVVARVAIQRVGIGAARQGVGLGTAIDQVGAGVAGQDVGKGRAGEVGDSLQHVALGFATRSRTGEQIDGNRLRRTGVVGRVDATAADQRVGAEPADQRVGRRTAVEQVLVAVAGDQVGQRRAGDVRHAREDVARRRTAKSGAGRKVDRDRHERRGVVGHVGAAAAQQRVRPEPAHERVRPCAAIQDVAVAVAGQEVAAAGRADQVSDALQDVALRIAARSGSGCEADGDRRGRVRVIGRVVATAADERVCQSAAGERVVARAAVDQVGCAVTREDVALSRADQVGDADEQVTLRVATERQAAAEIDGHGLGRARIRDRVDVAAANERVGAEAALQRVGSNATVDHVAVGVARQDVCASRAHQVQDVEQDVPCGIVSCTGSGRQVHRDRAGRRGVVGRIGTAAALERV